MTLLRSLGIDCKLPICHCISKLTDLVLWKADDRQRRERKCEIQVTLCLLLRCSCVFNLSVQFDRWCRERIELRENCVTGCIGAVSWFHPVEVDEKSQASKSMRSIKLKWRIKERQRKEKSGSLNQIHLFVFLFARRLSLI